MNAEGVDRARGAAGRPRRDGGASATFRAWVDGGIFCSENRGHRCRGGGGYGGGRR